MTVELPALSARDYRALTRALDAALVNLSCCTTYEQEVEARSVRRLLAECRQLRVSSKIKAEDWIARKSAVDRAKDRLTRPLGFHAKKRGE
tara:strand:- start:415 stop:687 length:273 start_codon:yes stop_codon:yes gene_type:complete